MPNPQKNQRSPLPNIPIPSSNTPRAGENILKGHSSESMEGYKDRHVIFSWRFFDRSNSLFNCGKVSPEWFIDLMDIMKNISAMEFERFKIHSGSPLRVHSHEWGKISQKYPFNETFLEQIEQDTLQFAVSKANGRVHGFCVSNVFYIVWLDPHHNLYPMKRHGGLTYCDTPSSCYDCLEIKNEQLQQENQELYEQYGELVDENDKLKFELHELKKAR